MNRGKVYWVLLALVLAGIIATVLYLFVVNPVKQEPLTEDQIYDLRLDYPLFSSQGDGMIEPRALDIALLIKSNNIYVEAEVLAYRPRHLEIRILDILFQGNGSSTLNQDLALNKGDEIDVPALHMPKSGFSVEFPDFQPGERYLILMSLRNPYLNDYWSMVSDDYVIQWDGLFYILDEGDGSYVLSAHNDEGIPSEYDGWSLQAFKKEVWRIRRAPSKWDEGLQELRDRALAEYQQEQNP